MDFLQDETRNWKLNRSSDEFDRKLNLNMYLERGLSEEINRHSIRKRTVSMFFQGHHVMSCRLRSCRVMSGQVMSSRVMLCCVLSCHVSGQGSSCRFLVTYFLYHVLSLLLILVLWHVCHLTSVMSCLVISSRVISCRVIKNLYNYLSCKVLVYIYVVVW